MSRRFVVIGIGADGWDGLGSRARDELSAATVVLGSTRQLDLLPRLAADIHPWRSPMSAHLRDVLDDPSDDTVHIVASGDPMFHGIGTTVARAVGIERVQVIPAVSSASLACARLGWDLSGVSIVSTVTHDVDSVVDALSDGRDLLVLSRDQNPPVQLAHLLTANGFGRSSMTVLEQLGGDRERTVRGVARTWREPAGDPLNIVAVSCVGSRRSRMPGRPDDDYLHDGQITKQPIRALTVSALVPGHRQLLWDIGSGSGSVAIEWLRVEPTARVVAFERDATRSEVIVENARRHGVHDRLTVLGAVPDACSDAPDPDTVFVGGGLDTTVLDVAWDALVPGGRLVANAVTVENQTIVADRYARHGGSLRRFSVETAGPLGSMTTWRPSLPIVQWVVDKP